MLMAATMEKLILHPHFDERGLGFFALGIAKASETPVVIITTSGTAVANLYPAVIEAHQSGVPLVVISADRPPRLQACGANQSICQKDIFGVFVYHSLTLKPPQVGFSAMALLRQIDAGMALVSGTFGGVLHLNLMFDEPLYHDPMAPALQVYSEPNIVRWKEASLPLSLIEQLPQNGGEAIQSGVLADPIPRAQAAEFTHTLCDKFPRQQGIIMVGALLNRAEEGAARKLAAWLGWPLVADLQSQLRSDPGVVSYADLLLLNDAGQQAFASFDTLLQLGGRFVSKRLQAFIDEHQWQTFWHVHPGPEPMTPGQKADHFFSMPISDFALRAQAHWLPGFALSSEMTAAGSQLISLNGLLANRLAEKTDLSHDLTTEPTDRRAVEQLIDYLPECCNLFIGNSLSIRLFEQLSGGALPAACRIYANRGASGIDGLLASACGVATASNLPTYCVMGDTSLLHDLNSLHLFKSVTPAMTLIVLNNDGGGIFHHLPVPTPELLRDFYQMPHGYEFISVAAMFGLDYGVPESEEEFARTLSAVAQSTTNTLIEIKSNPEKSIQDWRALAQWVKSLSLHVEDI